MTSTPDMEGSAASITDPNLLFARIGYQLVLAREAADRGETDKVAMYEGYVDSEVRAVRKLRGPR